MDVLSVAVTDSTANYYILFSMSKLFDAYVTSLRKVLFSMWWFHNL